MSLYTVDYRARLEGWAGSIHVLADSPYEAHQLVAQFKGRPIPTKVSLTNEVDHVK